MPIPTAGNQPERRWKTTSSSTTNTWALVKKHMENQDMDKNRRLFEGFTGRMADISNGQENDPISPLAITESIEVDIELSTGGPADGFKVYLEKQTRQAISACYYFSDWGWYKERWLRDDEIDLIVDFFGIY